MLGEAQELLNAVGQSLASSAAEDWPELELRISGTGGMTHTVVIATCADGSLDQECELDDAGNDDAAAELRESMYQDGTGTWYNARLTLKRSGELDADFDYDNPPFDGDADRQLLIEDQRLFPRDAGSLPRWHPSGGGLGVSGAPAYLSARRRRRLIAMSDWRAL
ncbi:uncharacterized protein DUF600 [Kribbella antiqua]|uniref:Uncharacterized protein DUF600 n=1 Tax=Kribbella antiqua TaxID=2512217 RepID=A0A4R2I370_9ACTN|nr:immunity protein YezG family protein [Kribbella antiqua]TCO38146.1 uncharacterized protein DUF600 [Kribbella antiqua]